MAQQPPTERDREIGQRILRERRTRGLTQTQAAELTGMTRSLFGATEQGRRKLPAVDIIAICDGFKIDPAVLLGCETVSPDGANRVLVETAARLSEELLRLETVNGALRDECDRLREKLFT